MGDKIKVVVIDDEADLCEITKANLEDTGEFEVVHTQDPKSAVDFVKQNAPDVILLDNIMPEMKGSEIAAQLKKKGSETKGIPLIMVSGKGEMIYNKKKEEFKWQPNNPMVKDRGDLPDAKSAGALAESYGVDDYVSKPYTTDILVQVIKEVIERLKPVTEDDTPKDPGI